MPLDIPDSIREKFPPDFLTWLDEELSKSVIGIRCDDGTVEAQERDERVIHLSIPDVDRTTDDYVPGSGSDVEVLDDLDDVEVPNPSDGYVLSWDESAGLWVSLERTLHSLTDVQDAAPSNGDLLQYNSSSGEWEAVTLTSLLESISGYSGADHQMLVNDNGSISWVNTGACST